MRPCPEPSRLDRDTHHISRIPLAGTRHAAAFGCKEGRDMSLGTGATLWQGACLWPLAPSATPAVFVLPDSRVPVSLSSTAFMK